MAKTATRQVSIFLNGKEVENSIKAIAAEQKKLTNELARTVVGTEEYEQKVKELQKANAIIDDHRQKVRGIKQGYDLAKVGLDKLVGLAAGAFAVDTIIGYGKTLFNTGVQMDALQKKAKTVFAETLPAVTREAEANARAMGLTNQQYIAAAASIQDLLIPMGFQRKEAASISTEMVNLSGALSEWTGGQIDATKVADILQSAVLGEREELKQLGISIQQADVDARVAAKGLGELTGAAKQQAEAAATLELILEKSTDAQAAFANGSGSLVRQQAEAAAKFAEISEKLATTLLPVFNRLLDLAGSLADGLASLADGIGSIVDPVGAATKAFDQQAEKVADLNGNVAPLLDRYDELSTKTNLSAKEQDELQKIITTVSQVVPSAVTQFDEYGKALGLNTDKAREFIEVEKARLKFINKEAADAVAKQIKDLERLASVEKANLEQRTKFKPAQLGQTSTEVKLTDAEILEASKNLAEYQNQVQGARAELARLNGENLKVPEAPTATGATNTTTTTGAGSGKSKKDVEGPVTEQEEKALGDRLAKMQQMQADFNKVLSESRAASSAEFLALQQVELDAITEKNKTEIDQTILFNEQKASVEEELRLALRDDKQVEIDALTLQYALLLEAAAQYGIDVTALKEKQALEQSEIEKKYADKSLKEQQEAQQVRLQALQSTFQGFGDLVVASFDLIGGEGEKAAKFQKIATLAKIAFDTAAAISSLVAASSANPANAVTFGAAGIAQYVTGIARIIANIAQAKKILKEAPPVTKQKYEGGALAVTGDTDGRVYNAKAIDSPGTGLLPNFPVVFQSKATGAPVLASERGMEYFVSSKDLRKPYVANLVRMIDVATRYGRGVTQFAEGGENPPISAGAAPIGGTATPDAANNATMQQLTQAVNLLVQVLSKGIIAVVPDRTVLDINDRFNTLNRVSGGFYE